MVALVELLFVLYLPGTLIFRVPVAERHRRAALGPDERVFWSIIISVVCSSLGGLALGAAGAFTLGRLALVDAALCAGVAAWFRGRLLYRSTAAKPGLSIVISLALVLLGAWLYFPPAEHIIGGKDPGVYVNAGVQIARGGSLAIHEPLIATIPAELRDFVFPWSGIWSSYSLRFMGFFVLDPATGKVIGQFPHLYPVWIAIGYAAGGIWWALATTGCWAILGLLAVYFTGRDLVGRAAAAAAAVLLGVSLIQIGWAREPNSEILSQPLLLAAIAAFSRAHVDKDRFYAPLAGALLGLLMFLRLDAVVALGAIVVATVLGLLDRRRPSAWFAAPFLLLSGLGAWYLWRVLPPYVDRLVVVVERIPPHQYALALGALVPLAVILWTATRPSVARVLRPVVPYALIFPVVLGAVYAYFFRVPIWAAGDTTRKMGLALHDAMSLRAFAWYLPPAALAAAVAGFALFAWRRCWEHLAWFVTTATYSFFFFYKIRVVPEHFWMTRRFVPMILPAAMLMLCGLAFSVIGTIRRTPDQQSVPPGGGPVALPRGVRFVVGFMFVVLVGVSLVRASQPVRRHVEYAGAIYHIAAFANRFGPEDLVIFESRDSGSADLHILAVPLDYLYGRQVLLLRSARPDRSKFRALLEWAQARYHNVYFVGASGTDLASRTIAVTPVANLYFGLPEYESALNAYPKEVGQKPFYFGIYRFERNITGTAPSVIDIGEFDDLNVVRFHPKERMDNTFRWTGPVSYITLPAVTARTHSIALWMSDDPRPDSVPPAHVTVYLNDQFLGDARVGLDLRPYEFAVTPEVARSAAAQADPARLRLLSTVWNPRKTLGAGDDRSQGVMVDKVEVR